MTYVMCPLATHGFSCGTGPELCSPAKALIAAPSDVTQLLILLEGSLLAVASELLWVFSSSAHYV